MEVKTGELNLRVGHIDGILRPDKYIKGVHLDKEEIKGLSPMTVKCYGPQKNEEISNKEIEKEKWLLKKKIKLWGLGR